MWILIIIVLSILGIFILIKRVNEPSKGGLISASSIQSNNYVFNIVGEQSYQLNLKKIAGDKEEEAKFVEVYAKVISEPTNQYDRYAIKVEINDLKVGYLNKDDAKKLAGKNINKLVPAVIDGGWLNEDSEGSYGVKLAINKLNDLI